MDPMFDNCEPNIEQKMWFGQLNLTQYGIYSDIVDLFLFLFFFVCYFITFLGFPFLLRGYLITKKFSTPIVVGFLKETIRHAFLWKLLFLSKKIVKDELNTTYFILPNLYKLYNIRWPVPFCYHTHGALIFNEWSMYPPAYT